MGCPNCGCPRIHWRNGVGFEHQMRCTACYFVWEPGCEHIAMNEMREHCLKEKQQAEAEQKELEADLQDWFAFSGEGMDATPIS